MTPLTWAELEADFDAILDRVATGEYFLLTNEVTGKQVVLMPYQVFAQFGLTDHVG